MNESRLVDDGHDVRHIDHNQGVASQARPRQRGCADLVGQHVVRDGELRGGPRVLRLRRYGAAVGRPAATAAAVMLLRRRCRRCRCSVPLLPLALPIVWHREELRHRGACGCKQSMDIRATPCFGVHFDTRCQVRSCWRVLQRLQGCRAVVYNGPRWPLAALRPQRVSVPGETVGLFAMTVVGSPSRRCMLGSRRAEASNRSRSMPGTNTSSTRCSSSLFCGEACRPLMQT